ncbi:MAG: radical SAM protein [Lachnospiraceae bacterium]|nr:radical SAM protein [Lachnospiraceae bacterium]
MIGDIMTISRLRMGTDGEGISTLVTFFDCPLHCKYCINDFCHEARTPYDNVPRGEYTPKELVKILEKDDIYYRMTGGGVVFGGGEPLLQSAFIHEVCKLSDPKWQKRIETSLNVPWRCVEPVVDDIDEWIIDVKDMDSKIYERYTGVDDRYLKDNIYRLKELVDKSKFHIRVPRIPGFNDKENIRYSVKRIKDMLGVEAEVFDYINCPKSSKYEKVEIPDFLNRPNT